MLKIKIKDLFIQKNILISEISGFIAVSLIFFSGVGRYRVILIYALYCLIKAMSKSISIERILSLFFLPIIIMALYLDINNGPIFPIFNSNSLLIALIVMIISEISIRNLVANIISNIVNYELFMICPLCNFNNNLLVKSCKNCNYNSRKQIEKNVSKLSTFFKGDKIPSWIICSLNLDENEVIVFHKKLYRNIVVCKNDERIIRKNMIITKVKIILLDYQRFIFFNNTGYREIDIIPIETIKIIKCQMKYIYMSKRPCFEIVTISGDVFLISLSSFTNYKQEIENIVSAIKNTNKIIETVIDISDMPWKKFS